MAVQSSHKLLDERPLFILPSLAVEVGLNEAIFIQQLHHNLCWLAEILEKEDDPKKKRDRAVDILWIAKRKEGKTYLYDSMSRLWYRKTTSSWRKEFPWFSERTIKRIISSCKKHGVLVAQKGGYDQTNYFSLDYDLLRTKDVVGENQIDPLQRATLALSCVPERNDGEGQPDNSNLSDHPVQTVLPQQDSGSSHDKSSSNRLNIPDSIPEKHHDAIRKNLIGLTPQQCSDLMTVLESDFTSQKTIRFPIRYFDFLAKAAKKGTLEIPENIQSAQRNSQMADRLKQLECHWNSGYKILANGKPLNIDPWPYVVTRVGMTTVAVLIAEGVAVEAISDDGC